MRWNASNAPYRWALTVVLVLSALNVAYALVTAKGTFPVMGWLSATTAWAWLTVDAWQDHKRERVVSDTGPRELDGDYAREFFDAYERQADEADLSWRRTEPEDES